MSAERLRAAAYDVLTSGNPARARVMAEALLDRDPEDPLALRIGLEAAMQMDDNAAAADYGRRLWRLAETDADRAAVARLTALALARDERYAAAQIWLRRAAQNATTDEVSAEIARNYAQVRRANPVQLDFGLSLAPSNNVNGGSSADTVLLFGFLELDLSEDAKALSGWDYAANASLSWRIAEGERSLTRLAFGVDVDGYILSDESAERAPDHDPGDWLLTAVDLTLDHRWVSGPEEARGLSGVQAQVSASALGGEDYARARSLSYWHTAPLGEDDSLRIRLTAGQTEYRRIDTIADRASAEVQWNHVWEQGITGVSVGYGEAWSERDDYSYESTQLGVYHDFGSLTEGLSLSMSLTHEDRTYRTGREDSTIAFGATARLDTVEFYGFVPKLSLTARQTESSFDRYDIDTITTGFSFDSAL